MLLGKLGILYILNMLFLIGLGLNFFSTHNIFKRLGNEIRSATRIISAPIQTLWVIQKLDHFDKLENRTWKMRYFKRMDFWKKNGPIYFFIGGEDEADEAFLKFGILLQLAKETNGAMFMSEHRYYGKSKPFKIRSVEDMKYLTTEQALADHARLIRKLKKKTEFKFSKVVLWGASYAGNLAAWIKLIYPNLVDAAIASSAPVVAKRDFYEALEVIEEDFKKYGSRDCLQMIINEFSLYDSLFKTKTGITQLKVSHRICKHVNLRKLENKITFYYAKLIRYFGVVDGLHHIKYVCDNIEESQHELNETNEDEFWIKDKNCYDYDFNRMIQDVKVMKDETSEFAWTYQTCTEYGYFVTTTSNQQHFTKNVPVEWHDKVCMALFGASFGRDRLVNGIRQINQKYGGRSPNVTEVIFVNGELDPWKSLSVLKEISINTPAIYIPRAGHCSELFPESHDVPEIKKARILIKDQIKKWIGEEMPNTLRFNLTIHIRKQC